MSNLSLVQWPERIVGSFWAKVDKTDDCWTWTAALKDGYGVIGWHEKETKRDRVMRAHRLSWEIHNGLIPDDLTVDHMCHNRRCVNPAHLQLLTLEANSAKTSRSLSATCKRGHRYDEGNLYMFRGARQCRICRSLAWQRWNAKRLGSEVYPL